MFRTIVITESNGMVDIGSVSGSVSSAANTPSLILTGSSSQFVFPPGYQVRVSSHLNWVIAEAGAYNITSYRLHIIFGTFPGSSPNFTHRYNTEGGIYLREVGSSVMFVQLNLTDYIYSMAAGTNGTIFTFDLGINSTMYGNSGDTPNCIITHPYYALDINWPSTGLPLKTAFYFTYSGKAISSLVHSSVAYVN